ncbi:hypothetical protein D3C81_2265520 [compost metagenome]
MQGLVIGNAQARGDTLEHRPGSTADIGADGLPWQRLIALILQHPVQAPDDVRQGIDQGTVEVENHGICRQCWKHHCALA